jgi:F0F1-type ATP synthase membrane subunit b/b'
MSKKLNKFIEEAIENIRKDRETTNELLADLIKIAAQSEHNHMQVSMSAAKYLETLQRSNEQLVKLASLVQKDESKDKGFNFSAGDKEDLYDLIKDKEDKEK